MITSDVQFVISKYKIENINKISLPHLAFTFGLTSRLVLFIQTAFPYTNPREFIFKSKTILKLYYK